MTPERAAWFRGLLGLTAETLRKVPRIRDDRARRQCLQNVREGLEQLLVAMRAER